MAATMGARGGATGEATELRGWNTEPRQMPLAQTEPALGGAPALRSPLRSSQSKRGATSNAADGDTVIRQLESWSAFSQTEKKKVEYPRYGAMHVVADATGKHWVTQKGPGVAVSRIALSRLTDLAIKWRLDEREREAKAGSNLEAKRAAARAAHYQAHGAHDDDDAEKQGGGAQRAALQDSSGDGGHGDVHADRAQDQARDDSGGGGGEDAQSDLGDEPTVEGGEGRAPGSPKSRGSSRSLAAGSESASRPGTSAGNRPGTSGGSRPGSSGSRRVTLSRDGSQKMQPTGTALSRGNSAKSLSRGNSAKSLSRDNSAKSLKNSS